VELSVEEWTLANIVTICRPCISHCVLTWNCLLSLGLIHTAGRAEPNRTDSAWKTNPRYEMEAFTLHAEPNRTEPDWACSLADVCFYSPADNRFCCAVGLTSGGKVRAFNNECKYIGLRSFNQCGAFKTGFVGAKWQKLSKQRP